MAGQGKAWRYEGVGVGQAAAGLVRATGVLVLGVLFKHLDACLATHSLHVRPGSAQLGLPAPAAAVSV